MSTQSKNISLEITKDNLTTFKTALKPFSSLEDPIAIFSFSPTAILIEHKNKQSKIELISTLDKKIFRTYQGKTKKCKINSRLLINHMLEKLKPFYYLI